MSNRHVTQALGKDKAGNIEQFLKSHNNFVSLNDGVNYYDIKQIEPESQMPAIGNKEIEIVLTDNDFDVTQINDSYLTLDVIGKVNCTFPFKKSVSEVVNNNLIMLGLVLKSGANFIKDYTLYHNGQTITNTLQNDQVIESFLYNVYKPKSEKNNRRHIHSLYENVYRDDGSYCGTKISLAAFVDSGFNPAIKHQVSIPLDDILALSGMDDFPNGIFGELKIKFRVEPNAYVWTQMSPQHRYENDVYMGVIDGFDSALKTEKLTPSQLWDNINTNLPFTREFVQCGVEGDAIVELFTEGSEDTSDPMRSIGKVAKGTLRVTAWTVERCICTSAGYRCSRETKERLIDYYKDHVFMIPGQRVEIHQFPNAPTATGLKTSQNIPLNHVTDLCVLFPTHSEALTTFKNPHYKDLVLNLLGRNIPNKPVNTTDAQFFQQMLNASDLDSLFEATDEYEDSLTLKLSTESKRLRAPRDATSFVFTCQVERSGGTDIFFDGLDTNGQNTSIELRGNPIYSGLTDIYYNVTEDGNVHSPPPILCCVQDTFWLCTLKDGRQSVLYETNANIDEYASLI